ncbi:MAG: hypothetical protein KC474_01240 [Cyanobacteria bacterium HKST-UBA04]|nr:hypothetical protein [Cyanobacteria bacterium HKST-UBA04]MCA9840928.1 hypothetical protein [Cyanobacteria bacterium HKST-UBA03]
MSKKQAQPSFGYFKAAKHPKHGAEFPHINADTYATRPNLGWIRDREVPEQQALLTMKHTTKGCIEVQVFRQGKPLATDTVSRKTRLLGALWGEALEAWQTRVLDSAEQLVASRRSELEKPLKSTSA